MPGFKNKKPTLFWQPGSSAFYHERKKKTTVKNPGLRFERISKNLGLSVVHTSAGITANLFLQNVWYITLFSGLESTDVCSIEAVC